MKKLIQKIKPLIPLLALIFLSSTSFGQRLGAIEGYLYNEDDSEPVAFANVFVKVGDEIVGTTSDIDGSFTVKPLTPGNYDLTISSVEYQKKIIQAVRVNADKNTRLGNIMLSTHQLQEVEIITYTKPLISAEDPTAIPLLWEDIERSPHLRNPATLIATTIPGVYQSDEGQPLYFRGSRAGSVVYFVDGIKTYDGSLGIPSSAIGEMTVYTGGVPAQYGDLLGGAIIVETKNYAGMLSAFNKEKYAREQAKKKEANEKARKATEKTN